ncbi:MAG TPA: hypothetical protein DEO84_12750 [candidate division Zixibacteria bacterium]|nr:hypothetical protein [candidate division Zixibacteria bacterium]
MKIKNVRFNVKLILCLFLLAASAQAQNDTLKVLFIGNSHTYYNNLPGMFELLAQSGGHPVMADSNTPGGYALEGHRNNAITLAKIAQGGWDYVVLQEQSLYPVIDFYRYGSMYPSAVYLDSLIRAHGGHTALYMTWGWRGGGQHDLNGHYSVPFVDYFQMQDTLTAAYVMLNNMLSSTILPAGCAWARAMRAQTTLDLWQPDNYHPKLEGSYIAACVFYAIFFHQSPVGLSYTAGLQPESALFFQQMADQTVNINEPEYVPSSYQLLQNYPNPFNAATTLRLSSPIDAEIGIYDIAGRRVAMLHAKDGNAVWDASSYSSGIYFARAQSGVKGQSIKLVLLK